MAVLRRMYGNNVPEPKSIRSTKWYTNPLTLGSFHVIRPGVTSADLESLSRDIGNLYFAGTVRFLHKLKRWIKIIVSINNNIASAGDGADANFHGNLHAAYFTAEKKARTVLQKITAKP